MHLLKTHVEEGESSSGDGALMWRSKGHPLVEMDGDASAGDPCGGGRVY